MKTWIIVTSDALIKIKILNNNIRSLTPTILVDGRMILPVAIITDSYWSDYHSILDLLAQETFDPISLLPKISII